MPRITFVKNKAPLDAEAGTNLMKLLLAHHIPVASSCKGDGICGKCRVRILAGRENLSAPSNLEKETMERNQIDSDCRLSCQILIHSDLKIDTDYW